MDRFQDICAKIHKKEYKLTPQRQIILRALLANDEEHLSAEDVYGIVKQKHPEIGLATVYRTLELLAELDVLLKMDFGDGRLRYEFADLDGTHHHHHLICNNCGKVQEFEDDLLEGLEQTIQKNSNFKILDHQLKFFGLCAECQKEAKD
ncbi:Fur family transcriptional regulator [Heliorestis convoluta]|uniref:Ferric uptake regulation protein n=1 Tax=Heliorestis convoluta TaxID=356322 RepID=A0A5Q2N7L5_9FIRM|nr:transcriptional repressor [Heliorestis convoluta]QGG48260.1 ferric uptake regulation protein [Heliorestis convoluta]